MKLTRKQEAFVRYLIGNPKDSATKAVKATYNPTTDLAARAIAYENLTKPHIQLALAKYSQRAELRVFNLMQRGEAYAENPGKEGAAHASVALAAAKDILDRVHGKATQKVETQSTSVNLNLSLTDLTQ